MDTPDAKRSRDSPGWEPWAPTLSALRRLFESPGTLSPSARLVFVALAWHLGPDGTCHPGTARLRKLTGLARATVFEALREL
ncbi:MAG: helix-turn-helix domain-containing protein, partial [Bacillota bacterium]